MCARAFIFADHKLEAVSAVKLLQYVIANLNLKELSFFIHTVKPQIYYKSYIVGSLDYEGLLF